MQVYTMILEINPGIFSLAVNGIKELLAKEKHPNIEIDCTILNENISSLESIVKLSKDLGGVFVDFDPVQILGVGNNSKYKFQSDISGVFKMQELAKKYNIEITSPEKMKLIEKYLKNQNIVMPCYSYCKDMLISPKGDVHTCWTIGEVIGNVLDNDFVNLWYKALAKNKDVLTGNKKECFGCGFSHSRMPDVGYSHIVEKANQIRLAHIESKSFK